MAQQNTQFPVSDCILSTQAPQGGQGKIIGNITFAQNRGNSKSGQPYKSHLLAINVNALRDALDSGAVVANNSGQIYINFTQLTDEAKANIAAKRQQKQTTQGSAQKQGGNFGGGQQKTGWGNKPQGGFGGGQGAF